MNTSEGGLEGQPSKQEEKNIYIYMYKNEITQL